MDKSTEQAAFIDNKHKARVLITGASGFIGNYVVKHFLKKGADVIATSRDAKKAKGCEWFPHVTYLPMDLNKHEPDCFEYFNRPDMLVHLAWEGLPNYKELFHFEKNLLSHYAFINNLIKGGLRNVVISGTCLEYGMQSGQLREILDTKPNTSYALAKDSLRKFLEQLQTKIDFKLKWIRLFYTYGRGQSPSSLLAQLEKALDSGETTFNMSGGEQQRDYLPVETVAEYIFCIAMQDKVSGVINCCSGRPISIKTLVESYLKERGKSIELNLGYYPYLDYEPMAFWGDNHKIVQIMSRRIKR